jgi:hypothetical protein
MGVEYRPLRRMVRDRFISTYVSSEPLPEEIPEPVIAPPVPVPPPKVRCALKRDVKLTVRFTAAEYARLQDAAWRLRRSLNCTVHAAMLEFYELHDLELQPGA